MDIWAFISDPENQKTLAWIGGGLAIAISALWTAYLKLRKAPEKPPAPKPANQATGRDGVTAAGNVDVAGGVHVTNTQIHRGAIWLGLAGCALIALGFLRAGDTNCVAGGVNTGGNLNAGDITINADGAQAGC